MTSGTTEKIIDYDGDIIFYHGDINIDGYGKISSIIENKKKDKKKKICLILVTLGGDPNAAYRISRALYHHYRNNIEILIPDICKSAGTLLCIGASKLIIGDRGELGPLDIQLRKPDEMFEQMSGLNIMQTINQLQQQVLNSFEDYLITIRSRSRISTKMAAEIATKLSEVFITPISEKIDALTIGEHQRAMTVGFEYGSRLNKTMKSLKEGALEKLLTSYPSHSFVIDRKEASTLFNNVSAPANTTLDLYNTIKDILAEKEMPAYTPQVIDIATTTTNNNNNGKTNSSTQNNAASKQPGLKKSKRTDGLSKPESQTDEQNSK